MIREQFKRIFSVAVVIGLCAAVYFDQHWEERNFTIVPIVAADGTTIGKMVTPIAKSGSKETAVGLAIYKKKETLKRICATKTNAAEGFCVEEKEDGKYCIIHTDDRLKWKILGTIKCFNQPTVVLGTGE